MDPRRWHLFAYDIRDPKRLRKVHACLRAWGRPIQYSVFLALLSPTQLEQLRWKLNAIKTEDDSLLIIPLCQRCAASTIEEGPDPQFNPDPPTFDIL